LSAEPALAPTCRETSKWPGRPKYQGAHTVKRTLLVAGFVSFPLAIAAFEGVPDDPTDHPVWIGELRTGKRTALIELRFTADGPTRRGTIGYPETGRIDIPLADISSDHGRVRFTWRDNTSRFTFDGSRSYDLLSGSVRSGPESGVLQLAPIVHLDRDAGDRLIGYYEISPGHLLSITAFPRGPVSLDYTSGRVRTLYPSSQTAFFAGPAFLAPVPIVVRADLTKDKKTGASALRWEDSSTNRRYLGPKLELQSEEVRFSKDDVTLAGTLVLPKGKGPHPALVRIHGAGPQTRRNVVDGFFAYHGVAYLSFDKRGTGKSTGDWRTVGMSELADDVLAAVAFLRRRNDIDRSRIGIEGNSEGGWIAPIVATRDPQIAFIVLKAGPALDYIPEVLNEVEENAKARGLNAEDVTAALEFKRRTLTMLQNGAALHDESWDEFERFVRTYQAASWFPFVQEPLERGWRQKRLPLMCQTRTRPLWGKITIPVLALYGGNDTSVPAAKNVAALNTELTKANNPDYTIEVFPNADHDGFETERAVLSDTEMRYLDRLVPGYLDKELDWVLTHTTRRAP
jgi:pimeloyl-ACP methyl ester carboxylesterase